MRRKSHFTSECSHPNKLQYLLICFGIRRMKFPQTGDFCTFRIPFMYACMNAADT